MIDPQHSLGVEAFDITGRTDEFATLVLADEGFLIDGYFAETVGMSWEELAKLLSHPYAQQKLEEVEAGL